MMSSSNSASAPKTWKTSGGNSYFRFIETNVDF
jgi:hypothetical protein